MKPHHHAPSGGFRNPPGSPGRDADAGDMARFLLKMPFVDAPRVPPGHVVPLEEVPVQMARAGNPSVTWLGHAAFIIRIDGKVVLTDPFLGDVAGPMGLGPRRFVPPAVRARALPEADAMVISHNHYDHLDTRALSDYPYKSTTRVIVPLGLGPLLTRLGYRHVFEQDWWDVWTLEGLTITTLPAVHFSGRSPFDRNRTLWASFAIATASRKLWFGGDTALGPVFTEVGERAGPFDLALVPIGAYEPRSIMKAVHANPEEALQIASAIRAERALGMHWGTIMLTPEDPFDAPRRFLAAAVEQGFGTGKAWILKIGESRSLTW
jgi:L-ascorbate metabolism protein UlaG (beta-lactamase superfamily)